MRRLIPFACIALFFACGGGISTTEGTPADAATNPDGNTNGPDQCGAFTDSAIDLNRCLATKCCNELNACFGNADGISYGNCLTNCTTSGNIVSLDGGPTCLEGCRTSHPQGAAACDPYVECGAARCFNHD